MFHDNNHAQTAGVPGMVVLPIVPTVHDEIELDAPAAELTQVIWENMKPESMTISVKPIRRDQR